MKRQFTIFLIIIFVLGLVPINFSTAITQNQIDAEVQIVCTDGSDNWFSGSGTIIDPKGIILTNRHVIEGAYMNTCFIGFIESISQEPNFGTSGNYNLAEVKYYTTTYDMDAAILYLDNPTNKTYPYINIWTSNSDSLQFGDKVEAIGFPSIGGSTITYTSGDFSGFGSKSDGTQNYIKTTTQLEHGNSGGASYNSSGQFIGIPTMVIAGTLNSLSYILSVNSIKNWLSGILGSGYQQEVIGQEPIIEEPTVYIQEDITPPNISDIELGYYIYRNNFEGMRGAGDRRIEEFDEIKFFWIGDCGYSDICLNDSSGIVGYYYYFGTDSGINPVINGEYSKDIEVDGIYRKIPKHFKMENDGVYFFIISFEDGAGNISQPFIFEYILERNYFKKIDKVHFYNDKNYSQSLGAYNFKYEEGGKVWVGGDFDDILTCKTRLNDLYFSWDYPHELSTTGYILNTRQGSYGKYETGEYIEDNRYNIKNISTGKKIDTWMRVWDINEWNSGEGPSDPMISYVFYLKPLMDINNKYLINKHKIFDVVYDQNLSEDLVCISSYDVKNKFPLQSLSEKLNYYNTSNVYNSLEIDNTDINFANKLNGQILLQVESNGEAHYIYPDDSKRYYLGRPADAFNVMRELGLGATHNFITSHTIYPTNVLGKILIDVEQNGEAYYIYPKDKKAYYLGRPADAFRIMRELGLGITNNDLSKIPEGSL